MVRLKRRRSLPCEVTRGEALADDTIEAATGPCIVVHARGYA